MSCLFFWRFFKLKQKKNVVKKGKKLVKNCQVLTPMKKNLKNLNHQNLKKNSLFLLKTKNFHKNNQFHNFLILHLFFSLQFRLTIVKLLNMMQDVNHIRCKLLKSPKNQKLSQLFFAVDCSEKKVVISRRAFLSYFSLVCRGFSANSLAVGESKKQEKSFV